MDATVSPGIEKSRKRASATTVLDPAILVPALGDALRKLNPRIMIRNPVMFVVEVVATLTTILFIRDLATGAGGYSFSFQINLWLWFTVFFANFAEAVAEGRGKAQAAALRQTKTDAVAKLLEKGALSPAVAFAERVDGVDLTEVVGQPVKEYVTFQALQEVLVAQLAEDLSRRRLDVPGQAEQASL